jgi:hypothetical protein
MAAFAATGLAAMSPDSCTRSLTADRLHLSDLAQGRLYSAPHPRGPVEFHATKRARASLWCREDNPYRQRPSWRRTHEQQTPIRERLFCAMVALASGSLPAYAASATAAISGHGWPTHNDTCFGSSYAMMTNNCAAAAGVTRLLIIPAQHDGGLVRVTAYASGNGSNTATNCQALFVNEINTPLAGSVVSSTTSSTIQALDLGTFNTTITRALHVECNVAQGGGRVVSVVVLEP